MPAQKVIKIQAIQAGLHSFKKTQLFLLYISEIQLLFLFRKVIRGDGCCEKLIHKYWLMQKLVLLYFGLSNGL